MANIQNVNTPNDNPWVLWLVVAVLIIAAVLVIYFIVRGQNSLTPETNDNNSINRQNSDGNEINLNVEIN